MPELVFTGHFMVNWRTGGLRVEKELPPEAGDEVPVGFSLRLTLPDIRPVVENGASLVSVHYSEREVRVLGLMAAGCTTTEIAAQIFTSPATVKRVRSGIYRKLGVRNAHEAVAEGFKTQLI
jgi:DNA-binding NarL/FixJ family response regulator